jgi:hypothetical protein
VAIDTVIVENRFAGPTMRPRTLDRHSHAPNPPPWSLEGSSGIDLKVEETRQ